MTTILGPKDYRDMPWKNGGGSTCEILREPADVSQEFDFRLSVAEIKENGPFSNFSGYSRIINTLTGAGMRLTVDGQKSGDLTQYQPFAFEGDSATSSELINGPIRDFNLIYKRDVFKARLAWHNTGTQTITQARHIIIYAVGRITVNGSELPAAHTWRYDNPENLPQTLNIAAGNYYCLMELSGQT